MAFRPPRNQPEFADLKGILSQSKKTDPALFKTIQVLIERLTQLKDVTDERIDGKLDEDDVAKKFATKFASYLTKDDDLAVLPNSVQLLAGTGITFDDSVLHKRTINASFVHYDAPLTDGNVDETDLIFALGECIIVQVPVV